MQTGSFKIELLRDSPLGLDMALHWSWGSSRSSGFEWASPGRHTQEEIAQVIKRVLWLGEPWLKMQSEMDKHICSPPTMRCLDLLSKAQWHHRSGKKGGTCPGELECHGSSWLQPSLDLERCRVWHQVQNISFATFWKFMHTQSITQLIKHL